MPLNWVNAIIVEKNSGATSRPSKTERVPRVKQFEGREEKSEGLHLPSLSTTCCSFIIRGNCNMLMKWPCSWFSSSNNQQEIYKAQYNHLMLRFARKKPLLDCLPVSIILHHPQCQQSGSQYENRYIFNKAYSEVKIIR